MREVRVFTKNTKRMHGDEVIYRRL